MVVVLLLLAARLNLAGRPVAVTHPTDQIEAIYARHRISAALLASLVHLFLECMGFAYHRQHHQMCTARPEAHVLKVAIPTAVLVRTLVRIHRQTAAPAMQVATIPATILALAIQVATI